MKNHRVPKVRATNLQSHPSNICFSSFYRGRIFIKIYQSSSDCLFFFIRKKIFRELFVFISKTCRMSSIDRSSSYSLGKASMQLRSVRNWIVSTTTMLCPTIPSPSGLLNLTSRNVALKIHLERAVHLPSLLMKTFKPYNGSECVIANLCLSRSLRIVYSNNNSL